jgi:hypothetical protein
MWRNIVCACFIMAICLGLASADTIRGRIIKAGDNKITVATKEDKAGKEYTVAPNAKVLQGKDKTELKGGLRGLKVGEKGPFATITTNDAGQVTEIVVGGGKKKKNQ